MDLLDVNATPGTDTLQVHEFRSLVRRFADAEVTSKQLIDGSVVLVTDNRVQVPDAGIR